MAAPSIASLFDFETHFQSAIETILAGYGLNLLSAHETATLKTPYIQVKFESAGRADDTLVLRPSTSNYYHPHYLGLASITVGTRINEVGQTHGTYRGLVRQYMSYLQRAITSSNLPYYDLVSTLERPTQSAVDADNDRAITILTFELDFLIRTDAWPAP